MAKPDESLRKVEPGDLWGADPEVTAHWRSPILLAGRRPNYVHLAPVRRRVLPRTLQGVKMHAATVGLGQSPHEGRKGTRGSVPQSSREACLARGRCRRRVHPGPWTSRRSRLHRDRSVGSPRRVRPGPHPRETKLAGRGIRRRFCRARPRGPVMTSERRSPTSTTCASRSPSCSNHWQLDLDRGSNTTNLRHLTCHHRLLLSRSPTSSEPARLHGIPESEKLHGTA